MFIILTITLVRSIRRYDSTKKEWVGFPCLKTGTAIDFFLSSRTIPVLIEHWKKFFQYTLHSIFINIFEFLKYRYYRYRFTTKSIICYTILSIIGKIFSIIDIIDKNYRHHISIITVDN